MKRSSYLGALLVGLVGCIRISSAAESLDASKISSAALSSSLRKSRLYDYVSSNYPTLTAAAVNQQAVFPFQSSPAGISRTYYPYYLGYPNYPKPAVGIAIPSGASQRSYSGNANLNSYPAYATSNTPYAAQPRSSAPYGYTNPNNYYTNPRTYASSYYPSNYGLRNANSQHASYRSEDPLEPEDPTDTGSNRRSFVQLSMQPRFTSPTQGYNAPVAYQKPAASGSGPVATDTSGSAFMSSIAARTGSSLGYGGNAYASAVPDGASYSGPSQGSDYAQSSPNTATGSVYNPSYGKTYPSYYGATSANGASGSFPAASLYPYYLYYPVEYGYDQGERSVMPGGIGYGVPLIGYKRRYGYRRGPYYGYGVYVDYPPYFGFGKVKDGWGSDPEADQMAAIALAQGAGASEGYGVQAQAQSNYGNSGSGSSYGVAPGSTSGYGSGSNAYSGGTSAKYAAAPSSNGQASYASGSAAPSSYSAPSPSYSSPSSSYSAQPMSSYSQPMQQYGQQNNAPSYSAPAVSAQYPSGAPSSQYDSMSG